MLTKYTSFVAVEEIKTSDGIVKTSKQVVPLPKNVSEAAVGFKLAIKTSMDFSKP